MPIQDNLNGALLISAIDFILSFIIIGGIGVILSLFPLLNKFGRQDEKKLPYITPERVATIESGSPGSSQRTSRPTITATTEGIHPGLSDQHLVALLTAAACETLGETVRIDRFHSLAGKNGGWAAEGRHELHSHRLK